MNDQDKYLEFDVLIDNVASNAAEEDEDSLKENTQRLKDMYYQSLLLNQKHQKEIERLEKFVKNLQVVHFTELQTEKADNARLREALEEIIECSDIETAVQEIAREALKGDK